MRYRFRGRAVALGAGLIGGVAAPAIAAQQGEAALAVEPAPWAQQIEVGNEYRGDFVPGDLTVTAGSRQLPVKCAVLPTSENDGFDVSIRQTADNKISNLITLSLFLEIGTGSCTDFKVIRGSAYDPTALFGDNGRVRFYSGGGDYVVRVQTHAREPEKDPFILRIRRLEPGVRARKFQAGGVAMAQAGPAASRSSASTVEEARTAYLQMCGKGQERLSAATCAAMRRDLDAAVAAQAAAAREAEVMSVYRQLCAPGARKLSEDTCASMLAEAKRAAALPAPEPGYASGPAPAPARTATAASRAEAKAAYDELCAPGAALVDADTCAALKADAATPKGK